MSTFSLQSNTELQSFEQSYGDDPLADEYTLNIFPLRNNYVLRLMREAGFERVRTYDDFQESYQENEPDFFIHVAEKSLSPNGQLRQRHSRSSRRRHQHSEKSVPIAGDAMVVARLDPTRSCMTDESPVRNGR